ncbi:MAG: hypothetical protein HY077_13160 [Elusimicrobia bacterium]|nr:hypothetical protein [Elusimicrobiota bacterium]
MLSMFGLIVYYLVLPFLGAALVLRFLRKYAKNELPPDIVRLWEKRPIEKKWFRAVRRDEHTLRFLGDFETHGEAVDCAYAARKGAKASGEKAAFLVLNDKGQALEEVDS